MAVYYFSTLNGKDTNSGLSGDQAWSSFSKLSTKLKAGDTVLLEKGSVFDHTLTISKVNGTIDKPVLFTSYGEGENPVLSSTAGKGIHAQLSSYIIVENLTIQNTGDSGIYGTSANNWILRNVTFDDAGGTKNNGSINWWNSSNILIENNTVTDSHGDGLFMSNVQNIVIRDNKFLGATGSNADNIQIKGSEAVIAGNILLHEADTNSTKGNLVFQGNNLYAHDNYLIGGSFGMSISANNVIVENNIVKNHTKYFWSSDIMVTDEIAGDTINNITIRDNILSDSIRGITLDGSHTAPVMNISNLAISGNQIDNWTKAPIVINNAIPQGTAENNISNKEGNFTYVTNSDISNFISYDNIYVPAAPASVASTEKIITIVASASLFQNTNTLMKFFINGIEIGQETISAQKSANEKQTVIFKISSFNEGDTFALSFANDKFNVKTGEDRNLYVHSVAIDGESVKLKGADLTTKILVQKDGSGLFFSSNGTATFTSEDVPQSVLTQPVLPPPKTLDLAHILESDDHVIFYGNEYHSVGAASSESAYGASFQNLNATLLDLHQVLKDNFG